jgi:hypothetical protein
MVVHNNVPPDAPEASAHNLPDTDQKKKCFNESGDNKLSGGNSVSRRRVNKSNVTQLRNVINNLEKMVSKMELENIIEGGAKKTKSKTAPKKKTSEKKKKSSATKKPATKKKSTTTKKKTTTNKSKMSGN